MSDVEPVVIGAVKFLHAGGQTAELIADFDWSATALGPIERWPQSLKTLVGTVVRSPVAMTLMWGEHGVLVYNDAYAAIAGARHPAALGSKASESWPEIAEFNRRVIRTVLSGEALAYRDQEMIVHRNGAPEQVWFNLDYSPVFDEADRVVGALAVVQETTQKVRAEHWLLEERERLRQMFEQAPGFMAMLRGPDHVFDLVNPAYLQLIGHRDVLGRTVREVLPDIEGQGFFERLDKVFTTGKTYTGRALPAMLQRTPGARHEQRFVDLVYQPVRGPDGQMQGIFVEGIDVTDRLNAETALRLSETRNRQILDSAIEYAIIAFDLEGRVTRWNEGARRILGWTEAEMLGQDASRIFTDEDRAADRMTVEMRNAQSLGVSNNEGWRLRKSGEQFWGSGEMTPIRDDAGETLGFVKVLRDHSEIHRAQELLRLSEERLHRAQEAGGVGVFSLDLATDTLSATPEFCRIFGVEPRERVPVDEISDRVSPETWRRISNDRREALESAPRYEEYMINRGDDGAPRWVARRAEYERNESGEPVRMVGVVQDITDRKAAERLLEESFAQFQTLAQALPNHVWTSPPDGQLNWFNDRVYEYSGVGPGALDGESWVRIVHPDDRPHVAQQWGVALASGDIYETEFRIRRGDGEYRWHLVRALPLIAADGTVTRWIGTNTDIHERKLQEAEHAKDRERIWSSTNDLMATVGADGFLKSVNPAWTRLLGEDEAALLARPFVDSVELDDRPSLTAAFARLSAGEAVPNLEVRLRRRDGGASLIAWSAEPLDEVYYVVGRDVTEQRSAEEALRQSQKMEVVGQLTGGIAHDFNNLLQGITGSLDLVRKRIAQGRLSELERFITGAMTSAERAAALTHRLLAFSRRQPLDPRPVRTNPLIGSMEDLLRRTLGERIEMEMVLAAGLWLTKTDPNQLESAILNLAINARDAMPDGGKLTIETCNAHLDSVYAAKQRDVRPGQYICICVTDTGTGMSADTIAKAFEPFFTTKPIGQGTGLGLSMIYGFARQSEGYAKIYSELGEGTTFKLYLPRYRGPADDEEAIPELTQAHAAGAGETVLVVEDEPVVRGLIVEVLSDLGYNAIEAADGPTGLELLQSKRRIDLLITDIGLPGLNGRQVADAGRQLRPDLKVLFMTGYAENAALASGFLEPGMSMVTKPFAMEALATKIRDIIEDK